MYLIKWLVSIFYGSRLTDTDLSDVCGLFLCSGFTGLAKNCRLFVKYCVSLCFIINVFSAFVFYS